jgi:hypothetical protein
MAAPVIAAAAKAAAKKTLLSENGLKAVLYAVLAVAAVFLLLASVVYYIATSPLSLLSAMFGGGEIEDITGLRAEANENGIGVGESLFWEGAFVGEKIAADAGKYIGVPYVWGGSTPAGFDCSGLIWHVYKSNGINIPRTSQQMSAGGTYIPLGQLLPGDILCFGPRGNAYHVALYVGGGRYIHAPSAGLSVRYQDMGYGTPPMYAVRYWGSQLVFPFPGYTRVTDEYAAVSSIRGGSPHTGIDLGGKSGLPIVAAGSGTVTVSGYHPSYGNYIVIGHGGGLSTLYAHLSARGVSKGESVSAGQQIGLCGSTGNSTGPHLHFEVRVDGKTTDPRPYIF